MGSSKKTTTIDKMETKGPLPQQAPYVFENWRLGSELRDAQYNYDGNFLAPATNAERQGVEMLKANAGLTGTGADAMRALGMKTLEGGFLPDISGFNNNPLWQYNENALTTNYNPNPNLSGVINAALDPITKQLMETVLPGVRSNAIASGAYGGARQDIQENSAVADWNRQAANTTSQLSYQDYAAWQAQNEAAKQRYAGLYTGWRDELMGLYNQERTNQNAAPLLLNAANDLTNAPAKQLLQAGQTERSLDQLAIENDLAKFQNQWYALGNFANMLNIGGYGETHTGGKTTEENRGNPIAQALQAAFGVASMAGGLGWRPFG